MQFSEFKIREAGRPKGSSTGTSKKAQRKAKAEDEIAKLKAMISMDGAKYVLRRKHPLHKIPAVLEKEFRQKFLNGEFKVRRCFLIKGNSWEEFDHDLQYSYKTK